MQQQDFPEVTDGVFNCVDQMTNLELRAAIQMYEELRTLYGTDGFDLRFVCFNEQNIAACKMILVSRRTLQRSQI
jgi:hypothetical protein